MGSPTQRLSPLDFAMRSEEKDISDTSKSAKRSCLQKSSEGCTALGISVIPSGFIFPSKIGQVRGLDAIAMLMGMFMSLPGTAECTEKTPPGLTRARGLP